MKSIAQEKSEDFAIRIIKLCKFLAEEKHEHILSKQIMRSGTSIGANLAEAEYAISESEFLSKLYISLKEANETLYWLRLLQRAGYITDTQSRSLYKDCEEIQKMLSSSTKTIRMKSISVGNKVKTSRGPKNS